jgi:hypothetical protein
MVVYIKDIRNIYCPKGNSTPYNAIKRFIDFHMSVVYITSNEHFIDHTILNQVKVLYQAFDFVLFEQIDKYWTKMYTLLIHT